MPRLASLNEHRNEHQLATCEKLGNLKGLVVVNSKDELSNALNHALSNLNGEAAPISPFASHKLMTFLKKEIG
jgi:UDP-N-acetylglucosamine transferase subunit ALG13